MSFFYMPELTTTNLSKFLELIKILSFEVFLTDF